MLYFKPLKNLTLQPDWWPYGLKKISGIKLQWPFFLMMERSCNRVVQTDIHWHYKIGGTKNGQHHGKVRSFFLLGITYLDTCNTWVNIFSLKFKHYSIYLLKHMQLLHAILAACQLNRAQSYQLAGHKIIYISFCS